MKTLARGIPLVVILLSTNSAQALPRFAARSGNECIQCHVNPSGSGVRNAYGRNIFEQIWLPLLPAAPPPEASAPLDLTDADIEQLAATMVESHQEQTTGFSGDVTDWLAVGADLRAAYMWIRPDLGLAPGEDPQITNTFFLMESYLYAAARLHPNVEMVLQLGPYAGFEAWGMFRADPDDGPYNLLVKAGRFMPAFGIRDVEHQRFTREMTGFGNADRDTGIEATAFVGPLTAQVGLFNGTLGETSLDTTGSDRRTFEKAVVGRFSLRHEFGSLRAQIGTSFYFNENANTATPMFAGVIPASLGQEPAAGLNELRLGAFATASLGRFTYMGDLVAVHDGFYSEDLPDLIGYASYQELSFVPVQGVDLIATFEFMDPNIDIANNPFTRVGLAVEFFPWPFTEFRLMARRLNTDVLNTGGSWDALLLAHLFM